jgi:hypothetical protein
MDFGLGTIVMRIRTGVMLGAAFLAAVPALAGEQLAILPPADQIPDAVPPGLRSVQPTVAAKVPSVTQIRVGRHGARTRVVLDMTGPSAATWRMTASGRSLMLNFPAVHWRVADKDHRLGGLIGKYLFDATAGGGGDLALLASEPVRVSHIETLPPAAKGGNYRLTIDLLPAKAVAAAEPSAAAASFGTTTVKILP